MNGGQTGDVLRDLLNCNPNLKGLKNNRNLVKEHKYYFSKNQIRRRQKLFDTYGTKPDLMFNIGVKNESSYHAISVKSYNPETGIVTIIDPYRLGVYEEMSLKELAPNIVKIWDKQIYNIL